MRFYEIVYSGAALGVYDDRVIDGFSDFWNKSITICKHK